MSAPVVALFNPTRGIGTTTLIYHLAWMYEDLGLRVVAADLDPQAGLTAAFFDEDSIEELWLHNSEPATLYRALLPAIAGDGEFLTPVLRLLDFEERLAFLPADPLLCDFEAPLFEAWKHGLEGSAFAYGIAAAIRRLLRTAAETHRADLVLLDLGPTLGSINRSALFAADSLIVPMAPEIHSALGLRNLGRRLRAWRTQWSERAPEIVDASLEIRSFPGTPIGYLLLEPTVRLDRPPLSYNHWIAQMPGQYRTAIHGASDDSGFHDDTDYLTRLNPYRLLSTLALEARKPNFHLKPADGAVGSHARAVTSAYWEYRRLAELIAARAGIALPDAAA